VSGVQQVVKVFEYGSPEEVQRRRQIGSQTPMQPPAPATPAPATTTTPR
jgi:hypothetical protein